MRKTGVKRMARNPFNATPCQWLARWVLLLSACLLGLLPTSGQAQSVNPAPATAAAVNNADDRKRLLSLADLNRQIAAATNDLNALIKEQSADPARKDDPDLKARIDEERATISRLRSSFEQIAIGGIDLASLDQKQTAEYKWQDELIDIVKPVLGSLKDITEKPRKIEALRTEIERTRQNLGLVSKALGEINQLDASAFSPAVNERIQTLKSRWIERQEEANSRLQVLITQLETLNRTDAWAWSNITKPVQQFALGRGLTLVAAVLGCWLIWGLSQRTIELVAARQPMSTNRKKRRSWERATRYLGTILAVLLMLISVLALFYWRNDILLLALALVAVGALLIGARHTIPRYLREIRLLLDVGPVREGERIIYGGIPMEVKSIGAYAILRNPMLTGIVRLPLDDLNDMVSRPAGKEPWFPTERNDYVWLNGDTFAQVISQSIEIVELKVTGSPVNMPTARFLDSAPKNITQQGFTVAVTFGVDYKHQAICLDEIPGAMDEALAAAMRSEPYAEHVTNTSVSFKEAAASSLDYLVLVSASGSAAGNYFAIGRAVSRSLVALCNERQWEIPFNQLTVHQQLIAPENPTTNT